MDRPSGLPSPRDRNVYNAFEDADFAEVPDGVQYTQGNLCVKCREIDFAVFFDYFRPQNPQVISLNRALERVMVCVFCSAVASAASKRQALLDATTRNEIYCDIRSHISKSVSRSDRQPNLDLVVHVKSSRDPQDVPWLPERLRESISGKTMDEEWDFIEEDPSLILELLKGENVFNRPTVDHTHDESSDDSESGDSDLEAYYRRETPARRTSTQTRTTLGSQIDFDLLTHRLMELDQLQSSQSALQPGELEPKDAASSSSSLYRLMKTSHLRLINVITGMVEIIRHEVPYIALSYVWETQPTKIAAVMDPGFAATPNHAWSIDWALVPQTI